MAGSKWANGQNGQESNGPRVKISNCCLPPERVELIANSKNKVNGMVHMGQGSKWAKDQDGILLFTPQKSRTNSEQQEKMARSKWAKSQNGQRVKMGHCCLPPERLKLTVSSIKNKWQGQDMPGVKIDQGSRWATVVYPLKESN